MKKQKKEFSKILLIQESALIWILTLGFLGLAFLCILRGYTGSLPWLTAMTSLPWTAYGVSQVWYYKKSTIENQKDGIKFESVMAEINSVYEENVDTTNPNFIIIEDNINESASDINIDYGI